MISGCQKRQPKTTECDFLLVINNQQSNHLMMIATIGGAETIYGNKLVFYQSYAAVLRHGAMTQDCKCEYTLREIL